MRKTPIRGSILQAILQSAEYEPDEDDLENGEGIENVAESRKNTTDPTRLTMDDAMRIFAGLRSLGVRRK